MEFVRFRVFDFLAVAPRGEPNWKAARYLAFILPAGEPNKMRMLDLGWAEPIDRMISNFRAAITEESEERTARDLGAMETTSGAAAIHEEGEALRSAVFDPLRKALGGRTRLMLRQTAKSPGCRSRCCPPPLAVF